MSRSLLPGALLGLLLVAPVAADSVTTTLDVDRVAELDVELLKKVLCRGCKVVKTPPRPVMQPAPTPAPPPPPRTLEVEEAAPTSVEVCIEKKPSKPYRDPFGGDCKPSLGCFNLSGDPVRVKRKVRAPPKPPPSPPIPSLETAVVLEEGPRPSFAPCMETDYLRDLFDRAVDALCNGRGEEFHSRLDIALDQLEEICGPESPEVQARSVEIGVSFMKARKLRRGRRLLRKGRSIQETHHGVGTRDSRGWLQRTSRMLVEKGLPGEAMRLYRESLEDWEAQLPENHPAPALLRWDLSEIDRSSAGALRLEALPALAAHLGEENPTLVLLKSEAARGLEAEGRKDEAREMHLEAVDTLSRISPGDLRIPEMLREIEKQGKLRRVGTRTWRVVRDPEPDLEDRMVAFYRGHLEQYPEWSAIFLKNLVMKLADRAAGERDYEQAEELLVEVERLDAMAPESLDSWSERVYRARKRFDRLRQRYPPGLTE